MKISISFKNAITVIIAVFVFQILFPQYSYAYGLNQAMIDLNQSVLHIANSPQPILYGKNWYKDQNQLPQAGDKEPTLIMKAVVTAYSSTPDQTDDTPFITANGSHVRDGIVATNMFPFGTKVRLPEIYGDKIFSVEDRMHERFSNRFDIWMETRLEAQLFGAKYLTIEVYK